MNHRRCGHDSAAALFAVIYLSAVAELREK